MSTNDNPDTPAGMRTPSSGEAQQRSEAPTSIPPGGEQSSALEEEQQKPPEEEKGPPYNLYFAIVAVGVGAVAYLLTMLIFHGLIKEPQDVAIISGALGGLFTLIGTVTGAYFGIKSTQDTTDKARKQVEEQSARTEREQTSVLLRPQAR